MSSMNLKAAALAALVLAGVQFSQAAVPTKDSAIAIDATRSALGLPVENRMQTLSAQGPSGYRNLVAIMFDEKAGLDQRWRAVTAVGRIGGENAKVDLEKAMKSKEWFMRNAALISMVNVDRQMALGWAKRLLGDDALVVRAAAVSVIGEVKDPSSVALLWEKLYSKENYNGQQSLFIRRRIVETLARIEDKGHEANFVRVLSDADQSLHQPALEALERITNKKMKVGEWQKWLKAQNGSAPARM